jgi:molecular chaperone GrpE (heat shock protein)
VADAREHGISDFAAELLSVVDNLQRGGCLGGRSD